MAYERKTYDVWEVQGRYDLGWEMLTTETSRSDARENLKAYDENEIGIPHRIVMRRIRYVEKGE